MKKIICLVLCGLLTLFCFCACADDSVDPRFTDSEIAAIVQDCEVGAIPLSDEFIAQVCTDYISQNKDRLGESMDEAYMAEKGVECYGVYDDVYVLWANPGPVFMWACYENVDGIGFYYATTKTLEVYCGGEFCSLQEAYDYGLLTIEDLIQVRYRFNGIVKNYSADEGHYILIE